VGLDVLQDVVGQQPAEEVELPDRRLQRQFAAAARRRADVVNDAVAPAEGVEQLLGVALELLAVGQVDVDQGVVGALDDHVVALAVAGDEPVDQAQRHAGRALDVGHHQLQGVRALREVARDGVGQQAALVVGLHGGGTLCALRPGG
jgi:hypothetical protein